MEDIYEVQKNKIKFKAYSQNIIDDIVNWNFWRDGFSTWEPQTFNIFDKFLSLDKDFLDIGAWVGPTAIYASFISKSVVAVEPDPVAFSFLEKNIELNNIKNIKSLNKACSKEEFIYINSKYCFGSSMSFVSTTKVDETSIKINGINVNQLLKLGDYSLIKIDIEGYEENLITDNIDLLINKPIFLSIHKPFYSNATNLINALSLYKFIYDENLNRVNINNIMTNDFDSYLFLPGDINEFC